MTRVVRSCPPTLASAVLAWLLWLAAAPAAADAPLVAFYVAESAAAEGLVPMSLPGTDKQLYRHVDVSLDESAVESLKLIEEDAQTIGFELTLSDDGVRALGDATRRALGKNLVIVAGGQVVQVLPIAAAVSIKRFRLRGIPRAAAESIAAAIAGR